MHGMHCCLHCLEYGGKRRSALYVGPAGVRGFFRGLPPTLVGIIPSRASYFWAYSTSKGSLEPILGDGALTHILSGIAAVG